MSKKVKTIISILVLTGVIAVGSISTALPVRANASTVATSTADLQGNFTVDGYIFDLSSDGTATVRGVDPANTSTTLTIPSSITVNSVAYTVTSIGWISFSYANKDNVTDVIIPDSVISITTNAFSECSKLENVTLSNNLKSIGSCAFYTCSSLTNINLPESLTSISNSAFYGTNLRTINIPSNVSSIQDDSFVNCPLAFIDVSAQNKNYASSGGVLFNKSFSTLIRYPETSQQTTYTIPSSVVSINSYAFSGNQFLTSVVATGSLRNIYNYVFENCTNLTSITLPTQIGYISPNSTLGCAKLERFYIPYDRNNDWYFTINYRTDDAGALYDLNTVNYTWGQRLLSLPSGFTSDTFEVSNSIKTVTSNAINNVSSLKTLIIPSGVTWLDENSITNCQNLETIKLPKTITSMTNSLSNLPSLKTVIVNNDYSYDAVKNLVGSNVSVVSESDLATATPTATVATGTETTGASTSTQAVSIATSTVTAPTTTPVDTSTTTTASTTTVTEVPPSTSTATATSQNTKTGDVSSISVVLASLAGIAGVGVFKKRK